MTDKPTITLHLTEDEHAKIKENANKEGLLYAKEYVPQILKAYADEPYPLEPRKTRHKTIQAEGLDEHTTSVIQEYATQAGIPFGRACRQIVFNAIKKEQL